MNTKDKPEKLIVWAAGKISRGIDALIDGTGAYMLYAFIHLSLFYTLPSPENCLVVWFVCIYANTTHQDKSDDN